MALLVLPLVFPLGVAPAKREFEFRQEAQRYVVKIVNNEQKDMDVLLSVDGVLRDFITFEENKISFSKNDYEKSVWYTVTLPADMKPGVSTAKIIAEETLGQVQHVDELHAVHGRGVGNPGLDSVLLADLGLDPRVADRGRLESVAERLVVEEDRARGPPGVADRVPVVDEGLALDRHAPLLSSAAS